MSHSANITKLNGTNYQGWKFQVTRVLASRRVIDVVTKEVDVELEENKYKDIDAQEILSGSIDIKLISKLGNCTTAYSIWKRLSNMYEMRGECNLSALYNNFSRMTMGQNEEMTTYIGRMEEAATQLRDLGETISDKMTVALLIGGLSSKYNGFARAWNSTPIAERTLDHLIDRLIQDDAQLRLRESPKTSQGSAALIVKKTAPKMKKRLSPEDFADMLSKSTCWKCGNTGHWSKKCSNSNSQAGASKKGSKKSEVALMARSSGEEGNPWFADSGASSHMSNNRSMFFYYVPFSHPKLITVGDSSTLKAVGSGSIRLTRTDLPGTIQLTEVLYVPDLAANLFSVGAASRRVACTTFKLTECTVCWNNEVVAKGKLDNESGLFKLNIDPVVQTALMMKEERSLEQWHQALGHIGKHQILKSAEKVDGLKISDYQKDFTCGKCPQGKGVQASHPSSLREAATAVGERVHADLVGPMSPSLAGSKYFLLFTDEASTYRVAYFLKTKDEVPAKLQEYFSLIESESGHRMRCLLSDNGSEFVNSSVRTTLNVEHAQHITSVPYTPEQNGVAERSNRTVIESARTILNSSGLPDFLWTEAVNTSVYILNRVSSCRTKEVSPFEMWFGRRPTVAHIHDFGRPIQVLQKPRQGPKFSSKTTDAYLVGFTQRTNSYRCYLPDKMEIKIMCDVIFAPHSSSTTTGNVDPSAACHEDIAVLPTKAQLTTNTRAIEHNQQGESPSKPLDSTTEFVNDIGYDQLSDRSHTSLCSPSPTNKDTVSTPVQTSHSVDCRPVITLPSSSQTHDHNLAIPSGIQSERRTMISLPDPAPNQSDNLLYGRDDTGGSFQSSTPPPRAFEEQTAVAETVDTRPRITLPTLREEINKSTFSTPGRLTNIRQSKGGMSGLFGLIASEPSTYAHAVNGIDGKFWKIAIQEELDSLRDNNTWRVDDLPPGKKALTARWVFKTKMFANGEIDKHKARLVARGFEQRPGVDFLDTYAPVARYDTIRLLFALIVHLRYTTIQFDVATAFLNGELLEEIFLQPPEGVECPPGKVLRLHKSIYGLKQSPKCWHSKFESVLEKFGLRSTYADPCLFSGRFREKQILMIIYVDDGIAAAEDDVLVQLINSIGKQLKIRIVDTNYFIGFEIETQRWSEITSRSLHTENFESI